MKEAIATIEQFLARLKGVRRKGDQWIALCPAHPDKNPSLSIRVKDGKILINCFAACETDKVCAELGLKLSDLFLIRSDGEGSAANNPHIETTYDYTDEKGTLVYQKVRYKSKQFKFRRPNGKGRWVWNLNHTRSVLYHLPEVLAATVVYVLEGEKDADTLRAWGLCATTGGGANDPWEENYTAALLRKDVIILPDTDPPGRKKAQAIAHALVGKVATIRLYEVPGAKDLTEWSEKGGTRDQLLEMLRDVEEWKPIVACGAVVLNKIEVFIRRFVELSESQARILSLWVVHTHAFAAADFTAYMSISSCERRCGKTRLLEVLNLLVANPWKTAKVTPAVLYRKIDATTPTLLLDESDAAFQGDPKYAQTLRGALNSGYERDGKYSCCVGKGSEQSCKDFSTFCAKAIAGIGNLPDTVEDRSVPIRLKRQAHGQKKVERFRRRDAAADAVTLREEIELFCLGIEAMLRDARPEIPDALTDRQADATESLLAIADVAGGDWPLKARSALVALCTEAEGSDASIGCRLLSDIRQEFDARSIERIGSQKLAKALASDETSGWAEFSHGPISPVQLARLLGPYGIAPHNLRLAGKIFKGYERNDFEDAWNRYLPPSAAPHPGHSSAQSATPPQTNTDGGSSVFSSRYANETVAAWKCENTNKNGARSGVAPSAPSGGTEEEL
jgi:5S rRNA maturation endonuclease (ribonuclease M5)